MRSVLREGALRGREVRLGFGTTSSFPLSAGLDFGAGLGFATARRFATGAGGGELARFRVLERVERVSVDRVVLVGGMICAWRKQ